MYTGNCCYDFCHMPVLLTSVHQAVVWEQNFFLRRPCQIYKDVCAGKLTVSDAAIMITH